MPGRTSDVSVSTFKPLSLQEILMVPLAKKKMEDQLLADADAESELVADVREDDKGVAEEILKGFKDRASSLSDEVLERGVSREQMNRMRRLKSETKKEYSSGTIAKLQSNKKSVGEYLNAMKTDKNRQAGYSPAEAMMFAQNNVSKFGPSFDEDGNFRSFSGQELSSHFDEDKFIKEGIDGVAEQVSEKAYQLVKVGGLDALHDAFQNEKIESKDYNRIMLALKTKAATNNSFKRHLQQMASIYGEKGDPLDFGKFEEEEQKLFYTDGRPVIDKKTGKQKTKRVNKFVAGKSRFGAKMSGLGAVASYKNIDIDTKFLKNEVRSANFKRTQDQEQVMKMYRVHKGELTDLVSGQLDEMKTMNDDFKFDIDTYAEEIKGIDNQIAEIQQNNSKEGAEERSAQLKVLEDKKADLAKNYSQAKVDYDNLDGYLSQIKEKAALRLKPSDRATYEISNQMSKNGNDIVETARSLGMDIDNSHPNGMRSFEEFEESIIERGGNSMQAKELYKMHKEKAAFSMLKEKYGLVMNAQRSSKFIEDPELFFKINRERLDDLTQEDLDANRKAIPYRVVSIPKSSKYSSSDYRTFTDLEVETMTPAQTTLAGKGMTLDMYMKTDEFEKVFLNSKGYSIKKSFTIDGYDDQGRQYSELIIRDKDDVTKQMTLQVLSDQASRGMSLELYKDLENSSDFEQRLDGMKGVANSLFMPAIKKSKLRYKKSGSLKVPLPDGRSTDKVNFYKNEDGTFSVTLFDKPLEYNGRQNLKGEQEIALALRQATLEYNSMLDKKRQEISNKNKK